MRRSINCLWVLVLMISMQGCATYNIKIPNDIPDGVSGYRFKTSQMSLQYSGEWKNSRPFGNGSAQWFDKDGNPYLVSCEGVFSDEVNGHDTYGGNYVWGKGNIFRLDKTLIFSGRIYLIPTQGAGCFPGGEGEYYFRNGWSIKGGFDPANGNAQAALSLYYFSLGNPKLAQFYAAIPPLEDSYSWMGQPCVLFDALGRQRWSSNKCSGDLVFNSSSAHYVHKYPQEPLQAAVNGYGVFVEENGEKIEGNFIYGQPTDGLVRLTSKDGVVWQSYVKNGGTVLRHRTPDDIRTGKACGPWENFYVVNNACHNGAWNGNTDAYSADGLIHIAGVFSNNNPKGDITYSSLMDGRVLRGAMSMESGKLDFVKARMTLDGEVQYEGEFSNFMPHGNGICRYQGKPEKCEFYEGERIDALYKTRIENNALRQDLQTQNDRKKQQEADRVARQQRQQALAAQQEKKSGNWGMKLGVLAAGAGIVGASGISADQGMQVMSAMASDVLSDGKTHQSADLMGSLNQQQMAANQQRITQLEADNSARIHGGSAPTMKSTAPTAIMPSKSAPDGTRMPGIQRVSIQCTNEGGSYEGDEKVPVDPNDCRAEVIAHRSIQCHSDWMQDPATHAMNNCLKRKGIANLQYWP